MSIKKNFAYNFALTIANYIFPLLVFPYVTRVLGVENIGKVNFTSSIVDYFLIFSCLGVIPVGIREIAKNRDDKQQLSTTFSNIFTIHLLLTAFISIILIISALSVPKFTEVKELLYVGLIKLVFTLFLIEWFFQGIQNFKFITTRTVIVKTAYVLLVFLLVKEKDDYVIYFLLTVTVIALNALMNWKYKNRFIKYKFNLSEYKYFIKQIFAFGLTYIMISFVTTFNIVFLGFVSTETEVGYYTTAQKLIYIFMAAFSALTIVLIPQMSFFFKTNDFNKAKELLLKVFDVLVIITVPTIIFANLYAKEIIYLIAGSEFEGAILPFRILSVLIFSIGLESILNQQILMCINKNVAVIVVATIAAVICVILNIILVPKYGGVGSSISWIIADFIGLAVDIIFVNKYIGLKIPYLKFFKYILLSIPYFLLPFIIKNEVANIYIAVVLSLFVVIAYFIILNFVIIKNQILKEIKDKMFSLIKKN